MTDPIADLLTRIRNAIKANHRVVEVPASNLKKEITRILFEKGYILNYNIEDEGHRVKLKLLLKYNPEDQKAGYQSQFKELAARVSEVCRIMKKCPGYLMD